MAERIRIHRESFENRKRQLQHWKVPASGKAGTPALPRRSRTGKVNRGQKISPERQLNISTGLRVPLEFFNKATSSSPCAISKTLRKRSVPDSCATNPPGQPYAHNTQVEMRKLLKIFLRWRLGPAKALALTDWLDTHHRPKTPDFLKEAEIERLYKHCRNARQRFLIAVLFDSGARAEEFHNLRYEDVYLPEGKENFVKITLKQEYSKTLGRTIALYWKYSLEAVQEYLAERVAEGIKPADPVFRGDYTATRKFLQRLGNGVLKRPVHYHLFRHSSTTHYATKLNRQELCYRYGWKFSSNMPDIYISRAGMETKALDEKFTQTELGALKDDLAKMEQAAHIKDERIRQLEESTRVMNENLEQISKLLSFNPSLATVENALRKRRAQAKGRKVPIPS